MLARMNLGIAMALIVSSAAQADLSISNQPTQNVICDAGVCTATAKGANLNVTDLTKMLAAGDTTVKFGGGALAIQVLDGFSWTSGSRLTLDANTSVGLHKPVAVAGQGALTISYNDGGTDGDLKFFDAGKIDFWDTASSLVINGISYVLAGDLNALAADIAQNRTGFYALANDYDATGDGSYPQSPIQAGLYGGGVFEGLGHTVANLTVKTRTGASKPGQKKQYLGLFSYIGPNATARDILISNASITMQDYDSSSYQAALVAFNEGKILRSFASGSVSGPNGGGLVGLNHGVISQSGADVVVSGLIRGGGLVASSSGTISASHASGAVSELGFGEAGGLVGGDGGTVDQSYATGPVTGTASVPRKCCRDSYVGGLFGRSLGKVSNSYATGSVTGTDTSIAGGISGLNTDGAAIGTSYSVGTVSGSGLQGLKPALGGFVGRDQSGQLQADYWDIDTSGQQQACGKQCDGVVGLTDAQLKSGLPEGFDPNIWAQSPNINNGYPYLLANPPQ